MIWALQWRQQSMEEQHCISRPDMHGKLSQWNSEVRSSDTVVTACVKTRRLKGRHRCAACNAFTQIPRMSLHCKEFEGNLFLNPSSFGSKEFYATCLRGLVDGPGPPSRPLRHRSGVGTVYGTCVTRDKGRPSDYKGCPLPPLLTLQGTAPPITRDCPSLPI